MACIRDIFPALVDFLTFLFQRPQAPTAQWRVRLKLIVKAVIHKGILADLDPCKGPDHKYIFWPAWGLKVLFRKKANDVSASIVFQVNGSQLLKGDYYPTTPSDMF